MIEFSDDDLSELFRKNEITGRKAALTLWHYVVSTDIHHFWLSWPSVGVSIGHGSCFGNGRRSRINQKPWAQITAEQDNVSIVVCPGRGFYNELIESSSELRMNPRKAFLLAGNPKLSTLSSNQIDKKAVLEKLHLDGNRKTILISSHWTQMSLLRDLDVPVVQSVCEWASEYNVIVTGHPKLWNLTVKKDGFNGQALLDRLQSLVDHYPSRLRICPTGHPFEMMAASDYLLCDHSSIRVEYSLLERPAALYRNSQFQCQSEITDKLYRESSEVFNDLTSLQEAIKTITHPDYDKTRSIRELRDHFISDSSNSAETIRDFLLNCGRVSSPFSNRWKTVKEVETKYLLKT